MSARELIIANLNTCWNSCIDLFADLSDEQWSVQSLCRDWTVKGIASHMVSVERALSDWLPTGLDTPPPFGDIAGYFAAAMQQPPDELVASMQATFDVRRANLAQATDDNFATDSITPVGPGTYGRFMDVREFDFWMHERDCRTPLAIPTDNGGPTAEMALTEVHLSVGYIVGKKIGLSEGQSTQRSRCTATPWRS